MRRNAIDLRPQYALVIKANCLVAVEKLQQQLVFAESVSYIEPHIPDRSLLDPRSALFVCTRCNSTIQAVHLDAARPDTPWFPR